MKLKIIKYDGTELVYENVDSFEFRTNQCANWIKIKTFVNDIIYIHNICVIKHLE